MSSLQTALDEYLAVRRALGYKLLLEGRLLRRFIEFAKHARADYITTELALRWATQPAHAQPSQWANRLGMVRRLARYCLPNDPRTVVPPPDLLPHRYRRVAPYIYNDQEIIRLLKAARQLPSTIGLRPHTFATLFGLIRRQRPAGRRSIASRSRRCGSDQRRADNSGHQVRQNKIRSRSLFHATRFATLRNISRSLVPHPEQFQILPLRSWNPSDV
jgi:hypothetical protein